MIATDRKNSLLIKGGEGLVAKDMQCEEQIAVELYNRIKMIIKCGDSVEIKGKAGGGISIYTVKKRREQIMA